MKYSNPMQSPRIAKVTVHICTGKSGEMLLKAEKLLNLLTFKNPVRAVSTHKIPAWGLKKGEPIGCRVTLRGEDAENFLKRAFVAKSNTIRKRSFDRYGNLSFGIHEYIDLPGIKYDPEIGIFGMDINVTISRAGYRVKSRRIKSSDISKKHAITSGEAMNFIMEKFNVEIE